MNPDQRCMGCMGERGTGEFCGQCGWKHGTQPDSPTYLKPGALLSDQYLIGRVLGHGGFGITYLAWDTRLDIKLAIKEYLPGDLATRSADGTNVSIYTGDKTEHFQYGLEKFEEEARTLARFEGHPGIVSVRDVFRENGTAYFVMFYMEGVTLKQFLKDQGGKIEYDVAFKIMLPAMDALREVHAQGLLHRDMTPDNIYITNTGQVKILDFGAARYLMGEHSKSLSVILKPGYAPEEQYRQKGHQGTWTDVYSVAGTFYRAITGKVPPEALDRLDNDELKPPSALGVAITPAAEAALLKALAVRAPDRFQTVREFQDALLSGPDFVELAESGVTPPPPPEFDAGPTRRMDAGGKALVSERRKTPKAIIVLVTVFFFVLLGGGTVMLLYWAPWDDGPRPGPGPDIPVAGETHVLHLTTTPDNARVEIISPSTMPYVPDMELAPGTYRLRVSSPGYQLLVHTVVIADQDVDLALALVENAAQIPPAEVPERTGPYQVRVKTVPDDVTVEIVDPPMEYTPNIRLDPGTYTFRFTRGGQVVEERIEVTDHMVAVMAYLDGTDGGQAGPATNPEASVGETWVEPLSGMTLVWVEGDCFTMGSPDTEPLRYSDESPQHEVCLDGFWMGQHEVTQSEYQAVMDFNPAQFSGAATLPVENVSWFDAQSFIDKLNTRHAGERSFRLPTEAEWEYACRAGTTTPFSFGSTISSAQANYDATTAYAGGATGEFWGATKPVGSFGANGFGLEDMHGNVYEWVDDVFTEDAYTRHAYFNPEIKDESLGNARVIRGGSWYTYGEFCRCAFRNYFEPEGYNDQVGFRVVMEQ